MSAAPLRILFCHYSADVNGGSDRSLFELVTALPRDRFATQIVLREGDPLAPEYRAAGVDVLEIPLVPPRRAKSLLALLRFAFNVPAAARRISRAARSFDADVVHVNTLTNLQGALAAKWARKPLVWHVRELMPGSHGYALLARICVRWATRIVAISNAVAAALPPSDKVVIVPNGVNPENYRALCSREEARTTLGIGGSGPVIALIARIEPWKGQHVLLEAAPRIFERHPNATVLFAGRAAVNKPAYAATLQHRCRELDVAPRVHFIGQRGDVATVLAAADVLVSCSVTPEPFGRTLAEAMHAGTPVIATRGGGPDDIVEDGVTGLLVAPEDPEALADAVDTLLGDPERRRRMAEAGRARAEERYTVARLVEDMAEVFEGVKQPMAE